MKKIDFTEYDHWRKTFPDRAWIKETWIHITINEPDKIIHQPNGRTSYIKQIDDAGGKWLRVILDDDNTVHNVHFDRRFKQ